MRLLPIALLLAGCGPAARWDPAHPTKDGPPPPTGLSPNSAEPGPARPTLSWRLPAGEDGARIKISRDPKCRRAFKFVEASGERATLDADLPSGHFYWCAHGRAGTTYGMEPSAIAELVVDEKVGLGGTHVDVIIQREERALGETLVHHGDGAMRFFAAELGLAIPESKSRVYFYVHPEELKEIQRQWARSNNPHPNPGFTMLNTGSHILFEPPAEDVEAMMLHELAHALQQKQVTLYTEEPTWLKEGVCDHLAARAMNEGHANGPGVSRLFSSRVRRVRKALAEGKLLPLSRLFDAAHRDTRADSADVALIYSQAFSIVQWLDSPANPERQKKFRAFLRDISNLKGLLGAQRMESRFHELFGDTATIEREWLAALQADPMFEKAP